MHGLVSKSSICYWQDQPVYYPLFTAIADPSDNRFISSFRIALQLSVDRFRRITSIIYTSQPNTLNGPTLIGSFLHAVLFCRSFRRGHYSPNRSIPTLLVSYTISLGYPYNNSFGQNYTFNPSSTRAIADCCNHRFFFRVQRPYSGSINRPFRNE